MTFIVKLMTTIYLIVFFLKFQNLFFKVLMEVFLVDLGETIEVRHNRNEQYTVCPRSSDPHIVTYYMTWVTTSWTHSTAGINRHPFFIVYSLDKNG